MYGNTEFDQQTIYVFARCEQFVRDFAETHNLPFNELGERVAELLRAQTSGETRWADDHMSPLRDTGTEGDQATREVEVDERPHRNAQVGEKRNCKYCDMKVSPRQMGNHVRYAHLNAPKSKAMGKPTLAKIMALRKKGHSWHQIADHFGVTTNAVWYMAKRAGKIVPAKKAKKKMAPHVLRALQATAAHARAVAAERRKAKLVPVVISSVGDDAMTAYHEALRTEPEPVGVNGKG